MPRRGRDDDWFFSIGAELQRLSDEVMRGIVATSNAARQSWRPQVDVCETPDDFLVTVELAGVDAEGVSLHFSESEGTLTIRGARMSPHADAECELMRSRQLEIFYGEFERTLSLPSTGIERDQIRARMENGFLVINIPKRMSATERRTIPIKDENG